MSNSLAIAAASATLRHVLTQGGIAKVTLMPLDVAAKNVTSNQVNLFLYQSTLDAAWRNQDMPGRVKPGEAARPPLPLNLYYLLTAYSNTDAEDLTSQELLGQAMRILLDHPVLSAADIAGTLGTSSDLENQVERVRITPMPLTTEEISKLWTAFQTPYRFSVAYQVSVILIESQRAMRAPLPVLSRGQDDRGATVLTGSLPLLDAVNPVLRLPGVRLGEDLSLTGRHLADGTMAVVFRGPQGTGPFAPASLPSVADGEIVARLPTPAVAGATWPAGVYTAKVIASRTGEPDRSSGELPFLLAPQITISPTSAGVPNPTLVLAVTCEPPVWLGQRIALLVGETEIAPDDPLLPPVPPNPPPLPQGTFHFTLENFPAGNYVVRLRVDGVDSIPIDLSVSPPKFADDQTLKLT